MCSELSSFAGPGPAWPIRGFIQVQAHHVESVALHLLVLGVMGAVQALCQGVDYALEQRLQVFCACTHFHSGDGSCQGELQEARGSAAWSLLTIFADACLGYFRDCFAGALKVGSREQRHSQDARGALTFLVHAVTEALQYMCQGRDRNLEQRLEVFRAISLCSFPGGEPGSENSAAEFPDSGPFVMGLSAQCGHEAGVQSLAGANEVVTRSQPVATHSAVGDSWQTPKRVARPRMIQSFQIESQPRFFPSHVQEDQFDSCQVMPDEGGEEVQAQCARLSQNMTGLHCNSPFAPTCSLMPCVPGQFEGCEQGSVEHADIKICRRRVASAGRGGSTCNGDRKDLQSKCVELDALLAVVPPDCQNICPKIEGSLLELIEAFDSPSLQDTVFWRLGEAVCEALLGDPESLVRSRDLCKTVSASACGTDLLPCMATTTQHNLGAESYSDADPRTMSVTLCAGPVDQHSLPCRQAGQTLPFPCPNWVQACQGDLESQFEQPLQSGDLHGVIPLIASSVSDHAATCRANTQARVTNQPGPFGSAQSRSTCDAQQAPVGDSAMCPFGSVSDAQHAGKKVPDLRLGFANVTNFGTEALNWVCSSGLHAVGLSETHLTAEALKARYATMQAMGWTLIGEPASTGEGYATRGGTAIAVKKCRGAWSKCHFQLDGAGFHSIGIRCSGVELLIAVVYLRPSEGMHSRTNAAVLGELLALLRQCPGPWILGGDFNLTEDEIQSTQLVQTMRGRLLPAAGPTTNHGSIIDHVVVSRHLEASASLSTSWEVPWRPHCALLLTLTAAGRGPTVWRLQQFPKIVAQAEQHPWPTEQSVSGSQQTVCIMGEAPKEHDAASALLCRWSQVLEVYHDQSFVGRGWSINPIFGDIPSARPVAASLGTHAGWWARVCHIVQRAWRSSSQEHIDELWAWLRDSASRWQAGGQASFETYLTRVENVFDNLPSSTLDDVLQPLREQVNLAQAAASKQHADSYKKWLHLGMSKGMKPLYRAMAKGEVGLERPFREVEPAQRAIARRKQWVAIWGDAQQPWTGESQLMLHAKQTEPLQPITGRMLSASANAKADKAGGLTGLTFSAVRNLPDQAYEQLAVALNEVEASGRIPIHWRHHQVCLIPKTEEIERPITLTCITYRLWCSVRYDIVQKWISEVGANAVWDRATPGNTCLEVGIARLVRAETSRCNGKHRVAVLFDLSNFYDLVDFELLEQRIIAYGFPARVAALVVQTYRAARHIEAEDILSEVIYPRTGMLAGCPFAVALAKTYLWPILQEIHGMKGVQALDSWVDDIGADLEHASATVVAQDAVACFRHAKILLESSGLKVSMKKTGFLTSSKEARRELAERRRPSDPKIHDTMRDLGLDCALARVRRVKIQKSRMIKAGKRSQKLGKLKVGVQSCRIRLFKGSVVSSATWGHQAQGMPPTRVQVLRRVAASHVGRLKLGTADIALSLASDRVRDPKADIICQHFQVWFQVFVRWVGDLQILDRAWQQTWTRLEVQHPWHIVKGPLAATIAHMKTLGWTSPAVHIWRCPTQVADWNLHVPQHRARILDAVRKAVDEETHQRISVNVHDPALQHGIDWTVARKMLNGWHKNNFHLRRKALTTGLQGSLPHAGNGGQSMCPLCKTENTWKHVVFECKWFEDKNCDIPPCVQAGLNTGHDRGFWERGLVAKLSCPARHSKPVITGEWLQKDRLSDVVLATDASGGPHTKDPRLRKVAVAIVAFRWVNQSLQQVASICCELPGSQTVFRGELFAVAVAAQRTTGLCDVTLDCQSVAKRLKAGKKGGKHEDIWHTIADEDGFQRLRPFWIRSHLQPEQFDKVFGFESRWRFNINQTADALCGKFAHGLVDANFVDKLRKQDTVAEQVLCCLASRVETILSAKSPNQHPTITKGIKHGQVTQECDISAMNGTARPLPGVQRTCKKKIGANVGHGHTQTRDEWFTSLVNEGGLSKHEWAWKGPDLVCNRCGWKLLHAKNRKFLVERENTPCGADGPAKFAGVHASHDMQLQGQLWLCVQCGGAYSVHGASSAKLKSSCTTRRDSRSKVQGAKVVGAKQSLVSFFGSARKAEDQPPDKGQDAPALDEPSG